MAPLPSLRQLGEELGALADTPEVVARLRAADPWAHAPANPEGRQYRISGLVDRVERLHTLASHLWITLRNWGTPVAPPPRAEKVPAVSVLPPRPLPNIGAKPPPPPASPEPASTRARAAQARSAEPQRAAKPEPPPTEGLLDAVAAAEHLGITTNWFFKLRWTGRIPDPVTRQGKRHLWHPDQLRGFKRQRAPRTTKTENTA